MFSRVRIAIRFFFVGLAVGVLLAPRSGRETRRLVRERADRLLNDVLDAATLGTFDSGAGVTDELEEVEASATPRRSRTRGDGRSTRTGSAATAGAGD
ncbi:MAG: YtxH domain-containing protein [Candidatus Limnocylindria bacterium]